MIVYTGQKEAYLNYPIYVIDGGKEPVRQVLELGETADYDRKEEEVLSLKPIGTFHENSGVWGIKDLPRHAYYGFISLGNDYFYVASGGAAEDHKQFGYVELMKLDRSTYTFTAVGE